MIDESDGDAAALTEVACRVCGNAVLNRVRHAEERMFDTRERFAYLHCARCGVLHLLDVPSDMARFYPADSYYSLGGRERVLKRFAMNLRNTDCVGSGWESFPIQV